MTRTGAIMVAGVLGCTAWGAWSAFAQPRSVVESPHNLSASGRGQVRAMGEEEVCIFCHTPHNATPIRPLWNRQMPVDGYTIYSSRALDAAPGQPTGSSKMCLSCHDGTIAVGSVVSRGTPIQMAGAITTLPAGASNLGTDLSDDHPISFRYDTSLATRDPKLKNPGALPHAVRLDANGELQCTTCHDAHDNSIGKFLVMHNSASELCRACHNMGPTTVRAHEECIACHQPHTAPSGPYLLRARTPSETCLRCHDGSHAGAANIAADMRKMFVHDTNSPVDPPGDGREHASCTSCHEPHTMGAGRAAAPGVHATLGQVSGINLSGSPVAVARNEYEVCFKCHADQSRIQPHVSRQIAQNNTRLEFAPGAISAHPVTEPSRNTDVPSLAPGMISGGMIHCSDCHASDTGAPSGGPGRGTHGSNTAPLLAGRYETADRTPESHLAYGLCYQCHDRGSILADQSFPHRVHVVDQRTPCSACHDPHGISSAQGRSRNNTHLMNFDVTIVSPDPVTGRMEFVDDGRFRGQCFLSCHGTVHSGTEYQR